MQVSKSRQEGRARISELETAIHQTISSFIDEHRGLLTHAEIYLAMTNVMQAGFNQIFIEQTSEDPNG